MVQGRDGIYIAWQIFEDYFEKGSLLLKKTVCHALDLLLGEDKTLTTNLPAQGIVTLMDQPRERINSNEPIPYSSNPKTTPLRYPKRLMNNPAGTAITK